MDIGPVQPGQKQAPPPKIIRMATMTAEQSDVYGRLPSAVAVRLMAVAAANATGSADAPPCRILSTERVSFFEPVPVGLALSFRTTAASIGGGRLRVFVDGLVDPADGRPAQCVMRGSFLLAQPPAAVAGTGRHVA